MTFELAVQLALGIGGVVVGIYYLVNRSKLALRNRTVGTGARIGERGFGVLGCLFFALGGMWLLMAGANLSG